MPKTKVDITEYFAPGSDKYGSPAAYLSDGVYALADDAEILYVRHVQVDGSYSLDVLENSADEVMAFLERNKGRVYCGSPYETYQTVLVAQDTAPTKIDRTQILVADLSHGTCACITNCPKNILLLGQND